MSDEELFPENETNTLDIIEDSQKNTSPAKTCKIKLVNQATSTKKLKSENSLKGKEPKQVPFRLKPFVFYEISEIIEFTEEHCPINSQVMCVGCYINDNNQDIFKENWKNQCQIPLDFGSSETVPESNQYLQIYGTLKFDMHSKLYILIIFWKSLTNVEFPHIMKYLSLLHFQRQHVSSEDLLMMSNVAY